MADEKDDDNTFISDGIDYSLGGGLGSPYGSSLRRAEDEFNARQYDASAREENRRELERIKSAQAKTRRMNEKRAAEAQAKRDARAEAKAESLKEEFRLKLSASMTSKEFEQWWKTNKLRVLEQDALEKERAFMEEAMSGDFGKM
jgi:hypothetical protein